MSTTKPATTRDLALLGIAVLEIIENAQNVGSNRTEVPFVDPAGAFREVVEAAALLTRINPNNGLIVANIK